MITVIHIILRIAILIIAMVIIIKGNNNDDNDNDNVNSNDNHNMHVGVVSLPGAQTAPRGTHKQMYPLLFGVFGLRALGCLGF